MLKYKTRIFLLIIFFYGLIYILHPFINISVKNNDISKEEWREDYKYIQTELPKKHYNLFTNISEDAWNTFLENKKNLENPEINLLKIIAMVGDSHITISNYSDGNSLIYPIKIIEIEHKFYIYDATSSYKNLIGKEIIRLNSTPISEVYVKMKPFIPYENENRYKAQFRKYANDFSILSFLGICKKELKVYYNGGNISLFPEKKKI